MKGNGRASGSWWKSARTISSFVYDPKKCEVLHTEKRFSIHEAQEASVRFAANYVFAPRSGLKLGVIVAMLVWEPVES